MIIDVQEPLGRTLTKAAKAAQASFDESLAGIGSSLSTFIVLRHIESYPGLSQRELAGRLGIEGPTLTHHLDRLASAGLVERVRGRDDRRTSSTVLTGKGRAHLRKAMRHAGERDVQFRSLFDIKELEILEKCLQRIIDHYGRSER
jgi:MarR family transcriptional regulator, transcriptional regulator for hemolysin